MQRTLRAFRFAGSTGGATEKNKTQTEIVPFSPRNNVHQVIFDFDRVFIFGKTQPV
jgi:hypothetical protein